MPPSIGLIISTYGTPDYIKLAMEVMKRNGINIPVLVHDDSSSDENLKQVCKDYSCELISTSFKHGHYAGDVKALYSGLLWAADKNLEILVKMSRRFIPLFNWTKSLFDTIKRDPNSTYGNRCEHFKFPLRTECVAYETQHWLTHLEDLKKVINKNRDSIEYDIFNIAKTFGVWQEIGNNRMKKMPNILWHDCCKDDEYTQELNKFRKGVPLVPNVTLTQPSMPKFW